MAKKKDSDDYQAEEKILIKGAPGRKSFKIIPQKIKKFKRDEALKLRQCFKIMFPIHIFLLIFCDMFWYEFEIMSLLIDLVLIWMDMYNYMTLNKIIIGSEIALIILTVLMATSHLQRIFTDPDISWTVTIIYLIQFFVLNPICAIITGKNFKAHLQVQDQLRDEKKAETVKGRLKLKVEKKVKSKLPEIIIKKANEIMADPSSEDQSSSEDLEANK